MFIRHVLFPREVVQGLNNICNFYMEVKGHRRKDVPSPQASLPFVQGAK